MWRVWLVTVGCLLDRHYVYFPTKWQSADWAAESRLPLEDVWFRASDGVKLHGWFVEAPGHPAVLLWCHGNAGNVIHRLEQVAEFHRRGVSVFIIDYRGYGRSEGLPSEAGLYRDALAAYDVLTQQRHVLPEHVLLYGQSLGAAVIADLATKRRAAGVILEAPFSSVKAMVRAHFGLLPLHWLLCARYHVVQRMHRVQMPVLVIQGDHDRIVPLALGRQVYEAAREPKALYLIPGADHNDTYLVGGEAYFDRLLAFIRETTSSANPQRPGA